MTLQYDISVPRGADWSMSVAYTDDNENAVSLSGYTAKAEIREYPESVDGFSITCTCGANGISLTLSDTTTKTIPFSQGTWDLFLTSPDNIIEKILQGRAFIGKEVAR